MVDLAASSQAGLFRGYMKVATGPAPSLRLRPLSCRVQPCHPSMNPHQAYHAWTPGAYRGWTWRSVTSPCSFSIHGVYVDDRLSRRKSHKVLQPLHRWARGRPSIASNATGRAHYSTARQCHAKAMDTPAPLKAPTQGSKEGGAQGTSRDASDGTDAGQTFGHESSGAHGPDMTSTSSSTASSHVQAHETTVTYDLCIGYASKAKRPSITKKTLMAPPLRTPPHDVSKHAAKAQNHIQKKCDGLDCGEDAFFITTNTSISCAGIADGVGGWSELGIDPSLFSWDLMQKSCLIAEAVADKAMDPKEILCQAYKLIQENKSSPAGSSTACIVSLDKQHGILQTCNLGDSGYCLWRQGQCQFSSSEQQHWFNAPFQLAFYPIHLGIKPSPGSFIDRPEHAQVDQINVQHGDVLIMATDGLFDNMHRHELQPIVAAALQDLYDQEPELERWVSLQRQRGISYLPAAMPAKPINPTAAAASSDGNDPETIPLDRYQWKRKRETMEFVVEKAMHQLAETITAEAQRLSMDEHRFSPFSRNARQHGIRYHGGKVDDITVIAGYVFATEVPEPMALL